MFFTIAVATTLASLVLPIDNQTELSGWFYQKRDNGIHQALDFPAPENTPYRAVEAGVVVEKGFEYYVGKKECFGNYIKVRNSRGQDWIYAHNNHDNIKLGEKVSSGQVIAFVGWTGLSGGTSRSHLHIEKRDENGNKMYFSNEFKDKEGKRIFFKLSK